MLNKLLPFPAALALLALLVAAGCGTQTAASPSTTSRSGGDMDLAADASAEEPTNGTQPAGDKPSADSQQTSTGNEPVEEQPNAADRSGHDRLAGAQEEAADGQPLISAASHSIPADTRAKGRGTPHEATAAAPARGESPPPAPVGKRPKADRAPRRPGEAEKITFDDLFLNMPADVVFRPFMLSERAKELEGERVSIVGYMHAGVEGTRRVKEFVLLRNTECKFGPGGQADHLTKVVLRAGRTTEFNPDSLNVEGTLKIEPYQGPDGNTWSIYRLEDAVLK